jgi:3-deoxy-alpha-D-manno-octulosonate 8-oxidase
MMAKHNIKLPQGLSKNWDNETLNKMAMVSYNLPFMWNHALGNNFKEIATLEYIKNLFKRL